MNQDHEDRQQNQWQSFGDIEIQGHDNKLNVIQGTSVTVNQPTIVQQISTDENKAKLNELLKSCTVKLSIPGKSGWVTGFFIAPGLILTCAHEVKGADDNIYNIVVCCQNQENFAKAAVYDRFNSVDLAILKFDLPANSNHPCVYLDNKAVQPKDELYTYGYSDGNSKEGSYVVEEVSQDRTEDDLTIIKFRSNQDDLPLLRSSPLLNKQTCKVCGIVKFTRDSNNTSGGEAISAVTILAKISNLKDKQAKFHQKNRDWSSLLPLVRCKPRTVLFASIGMTALVILIRAFQVFQPFELGFYDSLMRNQFNPPKPSDRFLIIKITKQDAEAQEKRGEVMTYSLSNVTLVNLLQKVQKLEPIAIGLDIYREQTLNVQPTASAGQTPVARSASATEKDRIAKQTLSTLFQQPNLFAVCKAGDEKDPEGISPPPGVTPARVGFSDFSQDKDGILRRQLLAFYNDPKTHPRCSSTKSFSLLLAERYLQRKKKINPEDKVSKETCQIQFSNGVVLTNLQPNTGGYQGYSGSASDLFNGCQILLKYREQKKDQEYKAVTLEEFLKPDFPAKDFNKPIVMIGIDRSDGISDNWRTPYDQGHDEVTPGVIVQAQMIEQIIDVAEKKDTLIWVLPRRVDLLLIFIFALVGGGVGWWLTSLPELGILIVISGGTVVVISMVFFHFNGWVPLMPHFLAQSATSSYIWWANQRLKLNPNVK
ncbi:MAG: CHASE2 domain-containing protein [Xenococcaceae cyanobacterium MO_188.B29]|nr:CHASE2 domain-containing protein [Xenococcaceae cyanobacterium MO_188.B29]